MYRSFNARALGLDLSATRTLELAASAGFEGVDLLVRDLIDAGDDPATIRARMDDLGLRGGAWPLPVRWRGDSEMFRADLASLPRLARAASVLGLTRTGTWIMPETTGRPGMLQSRANYLEAIAEEHHRRLGAIARVLADQGTSLGLEVIGVDSFRTGRGLPFIHRMADVGPLLARLRGGSPNVGVLIDFFHLHAAGESIEAALAWGIDRVVWVHVADRPASFAGDRTALQDGDRGLPDARGGVEAGAWLRRLDGLGYDGPVTAEPMAGCRALERLTPEEAARKVATALASVWPAES